MTSRYTAVPKAIFSTELDTVATAFPKRPDLPDTSDRRRLYSSAILASADALMVAPRVTFKVTGENVVLAVLTRMFGPSAVMELLESGAIEFVLWRSLILNTGQDMMTKGLSPLAAGNSTDPIHSDPKESALAGMKWNATLDRKIRRDVAKKAARCTLISPEKAPHQATNAVLEAYRSGILLSDGFDPNVSEYNLDGDAQSKLNLMAFNLAESAVLLEHEWDLYEAEPTWQSMMQVAKEIRSSKDVIGVVEEIIKFERAPSVRDLLLQKKLSMQDVLRMRKSAEVRDFQQWLWGRPDPACTKDIVDAYAALVTKGSRTQVTDREWFRILRIIGVAFAGGAVGNALAGPVGDVLGAASAAAASNLGSAGISYLDLLSSRIAGRSNPRRFAALLRNEEILSDMSSLREK